MKAVFVLGTSTGGTARHVKMLADGCAARGLPVEVFGPARTDRDFGFGNRIRFVPVDIADRPRLHRDLRTIASLRRLIRAGQPDLVHAHGLRAGALTAIAVAFARPRPFRVRRPDAPPALIATVHNAPPAGRVNGTVYRVLELIVARHAVSVLCVSRDLERRMRAAGARRVGRAVVPAPPAAGTRDLSAETRSATRAELGAGPGTGPPSVRDPASAAGRPVVLAVGRLAEQKGFATLIDAAVLWRDIRPEPLLVIAGQGPLEAELDRRAASLAVAVTFAGHRLDVPALLAAADVFVLPSAWEGQPLILQEALRAGVPIVASRVGGIPELAGEDGALLVPPGDAHRLADAVGTVLSDPVLAARLRQGALDRARALPGEDEAVAAALAEYRRAVLSRSARSRSARAGVRRRRALRT